MLIDNFKEYCFNLGTAMDNLKDLSIAVPPSPFYLSLKKDLRTFSLINLNLVINK